VQLPESGIRMRKRDAGLHGSAVARSQENDAAILLLLREQVSEQQGLSLLYRDAQQQQGAIRIHVQRVRFFMEGFFPRFVPVHVHGDVEGPAAASSPVGILRRILCARFRRCFGGANQLRLFQRFKNSAHGSSYDPAGIGQAKNKIL
jgi:hypothetical protein